MTVVVPGNGLVELIRNATRRIIIVAPYIKSPALRRLLDAIPDTVSECICVTRWLPEDIASGVCDLEILDDLAQAYGGRLLLHPHLHAKYYSNGLQSLVGSANLTARGLGRHAPSNIELLVALPADFAGLMEWEQSLLNSAVEASNKLRDQIRRQAELLQQAKTRHHVPEVEQKSVGKEESILWLPRCPVSDRLWDVYRGRGADTMVSSAFEAALADLTALSPPQGLTQDLFAAYIAAILKQIPLLVEIDKLASSGLTDAKAHKLLADRPRLKTVKALPGHQLQMTFIDGSTKTADFTPLFDESPGLAPLHDEEAFAKACSGEDEGWTVEWPELDIQIGADTLWLDAMAQSAPDKNTRELARWRTRNGLSLAAAAEALGIAPRTMSAYDTGGKPVPRYIALACKGWEVERKGDH